LPNGQRPSLRLGGDSIPSMRTAKKSVGGGSEAAIPAVWTSLTMYSGSPANLDNL
jgi:hypothetical protein